MGRLDGKVALVTGAGRARGIGRAVALELAREGASVAVTDYGRGGGATMLGRETTGDVDGIEATVGLVTAEGGTAIGLPLDVTDQAEVDAVVEQLAVRLGGLDVVVNNAGTPVGAQALPELPADDWRLSWEVNVMGCVRTIRAALPAMRAGGTGSVVNMASIAGVLGFSNFSAYCATKHAVVGLTKSLAAELGADGIRVNAVCPGDIDTQMADIPMEMAAQLGIDAAQDQGLRPALGRRGMAEDVARLVAFLASPQSDYITGAAIRIDGGTDTGL